MLSNSTPQDALPANKSLNRRLILIAGIATVAIGGIIAYSLRSTDFFSATTQEMPEVTVTEIKTWPETPTTGTIRTSLSPLSKHIGESSRASRYAPSIGTGLFSAGFNP